jgi:ATP-binding cassette subfamily B protein
MSVYRRTLVYFKPFLGETVLATLLTLLSIGLNLLKPVPIRFIIDHVLLSPDRGRGFLMAHGLAPETPGTIALALCGILVLIQLLGGFIGLATSLLFVKVGLQALLNLRTELYSYLQSLPLKYHDARRSSDSTFRVAYDSQSIQTIYNKGFSNIFNSTITLACTFFVMWRMDAELTLLSLGIVPLIVAAIYFYANRIRTESTTIQERESAVLAAAQEGLSSIRMVHAFGREEFEVKQFQRHARESLEANLKLTMTSVSSALVVGTLMAVGTAVMWYVGSLHVLDKVLTLGALQQFAAYLLMLYAPLESLT